MSADRHKRDIRRGLSRITAAETRMSADGARIISKLDMTTRLHSMCNADFVADHGGDADERGFSKLDIAARGLARIAVEARIGRLDADHL